jgi:hypothetical protein
MTRHILENSHKFEQKCQIKHIIIVVPSCAEHSIAPYETNGFLNGLYCAGNSSVQFVSKGARRRFTLVDVYIRGASNVLFEAVILISFKGTHTFEEYNCQFNSRRCFSSWLCIESNCFRMRSFCWIVHLYTGAHCRCEHAQVQGVFENCLHVDCVLSTKNS